MNLKNGSTTVFTLLMIFSLQVWQPPVSAQTAFGDDGVVISLTPDYTNAWARDIEIDEDGSVLVAGGAGNNGPTSLAQELAIFKYRENGVLDNSFDSDGIAITDIEEADAHNASTIYSRRGLTLDELGHPTVLGHSANFSASGTHDVVLARFIATGDPDVSFDTDGVTGPTLPNDIEGSSGDMVRRANGGYIVAGTFDFADDGGIFGGPGLAAFTASGTLDMAFGDNGVALTQPPGFDGSALWNGVVMDASNRIVVAGSTRNTPNDSMIVGRFLSNGDEDISFSGDGHLSIALETEAIANALAVDADGRIVVAGCYTATIPINDEESQTSINGFVVVRLLANGELDASFGVDGVVHTPIVLGDPEAPSGCAYDVKIDRKGRIVAAGFAVDSRGDTETQIYATARYMPDGMLDVGFAGQGVVTSQLGELSFGSALVIDQQDRIFIAGHTRLDGDYHAAVLCLTDLGFRCRDYAFEYPVKVICGDAASTARGQLTPGRYATTINVHSPGRVPVIFQKKLALSIPPGFQNPGRIFGIAEDRLTYDEALAVDCDDLNRRLYPDGWPEDDQGSAFIEGFVVLQSTGSLDVTAVYTTADLDDDGMVRHSSIDVESIVGRLPRTDVAVEKTAEVVPLRYEINDLLSFSYHVGLITIDVTNHGPDTVAAPSLIDAINLDVIGTPDLTSAAIVTFPEWIVLPPGGQLNAIEQQDLYQINVDTTLPNMDAGETVTLEIWVLGLTVAQDPGDIAGELRDRVSILAGAGDENGANNSATATAPIVH